MWRSAYLVDGPLFFGSTTRFLEQFSPKTDPDDVVVDFMQSRVADHSALVAINTLADKSAGEGFIFGDSKKSKKGLKDLIFVFMPITIVNFAKM